MAIAVRTRSAAKAAQASCEAVVRSTVPSVRAVNLGKFSGRRGKHHEVQVVVKEEIHETLVDQRVTVTPAKQSRKRGLRNEKAEKVTKKVRSGAHAALTITDDAPFNNPATTTTIKTPTKSPVKAPLPPRQPPKGWLETYSLIKELREPRDAPVDSMGCEALVQQPPEVDPKTSRYQVLIALMLSSQTKDQTVAEAMRNLQAHGLTVENILATDPAKLNSLIAKVGFHNNKTKFILQATQILKERHGSDVPATLDELVALPGVGPKMAFITLSAAHGIDPGIGIDTHMHRSMRECSAHAVYLSRNIAFDPAFLLDLFGLVAMVTENPHYISYERDRLGLIQGSGSDSGAAGIMVA